MNRDNILRIANTVFDSVHNVSEGIYRGELKINSKKPAGIYFLDLNKDIPVETFSDYQEKLLADEYYKHPGSLQWNFYLLLLQDGMDKKQRELIERNDKYARKYVFDEKQFEDYFKLESSSVELSGNIVLDMKKRLDSVGLSFVYSKDHYKESVDLFLQNHSKLPLSETRQSEPSRSGNIKFINRIKLNPNYREFPIDRIFHFGKVNLVKGINGVGKTSLFEAIELISCGKTFRNPDIREKDTCIEAVINNNFTSVETCTPSQTEKYRSRDLLWYNNEYSRDNFTHDSFNRFNFFNTDAANELATSNDEKSVKTALSNLVLGPEYSYLTERIEGFYTRIKPEYRRLSDALREAEKTISDSDKIINRLQNSDSVLSIRDTVTANILDLHFLRQDINLEKDTSEIETLVNRLIVQLEAFEREDPESIRSYTDMIPRKKTLTEKYAVFEKFKTDLENTDKEIRENQQEESSFQEKIRLLNNSIKYFADLRNFDIPGYSRRMAACEQSLKTIEFTKKALDGINIQDYILPDKPGDLIQKNNEKLDELKATILETENQTSRILNQFDKVSQLVSQIKTLGKEYIAADLDGHICPLCQTDFQRTEFVTRVDTILSSNTVPSRELEELSKKRLDLNDETEKLTRDNNHINIINATTDSVREKNTSVQSLAEMIQFINLLLAGEHTLLKQKSELSAFGEWLTINSLSESEFEYLGTQISIVFGDELPFTFANKTGFENLLFQINEAIGTKRKEIETLIVQKTNDAHELKTKLSLPQERNYEPSQILSLLDGEQNKLSRLEDSFRKIRDIIQLADETPVSDIREKTSLLDKNIKTLKEDIQSQFELRNAESEKKKAVAYTSSARPDIERIKKGHDTLQQLSEKTGTSQIDQFFRQNLVEINYIFHSIHTPREFKEFVYQNNQLVLITENGVPRTISEISTGQRAALALSIFISLNRKLKNGPDILLFDDPVSHIDDLNALSFIDYLRYEALTKKKQIFFATANARLADLVEKKFEFLDADFKKIELKR